MRIPTVPYPHQLNYSAFSIFVNCDIFVCFLFCFCYLLFGKGQILRDHICHLWARDVSYNVAFQTSVVYQWTGPLVLCQPYCQNLNALYSLGIWENIPRLLDISSIYKSSCSFTCSNNQLENCTLELNAFKLPKI